MTLTTGAGAIKFHFSLSRDLPSSFDFGGEPGSIVYEIQAFMEGPGKRDKVSLHVKRIVNVNQTAVATLPVTLRRSKAVGLCCWKSGPVSFALRLPKAGFIPGE